MAALREQISAPVGADVPPGGNQPADVARIQAFLNAVPPALGGPEPRLKQDGFIGPKTIGAIEAFQKHQFGESDRRVDPGKRSETTLARLEDDAATRPGLHVEAARRQAQAWFRPALEQVTRNIDAAGHPTLDPLRGRDFAQRFRWIFSLPVLPDPGGRPATPDQLAFMRRKFESAGQFLSGRVRTLQIKFMDMHDELREPQVHRRSPLAASTAGIFATYKFADWDATCGFGMGPLTRAAIFLQAAFICADYNPNFPLTADELWIASGLASPDLAMRESGRFSYFCQSAAAGDSGMTRFYHVPSTGAGWNDVPDLP